MQWDIFTLCYDSLIFGGITIVCARLKEKKKRTKMCCIKRSHDRGIADDKVRKLENIDNFWKQNTLCKRWNVGYMSVLEWCGSLGWNPSPVEHNGNFSFHCNKIKFSLAPRFKSMWRCSEISSLETNVVWFRHFHSFSAVQSSPMSSRALSWSSFTTQVSHRREFPPSPPQVRNCTRSPNA